MTEQEILLLIRQHIEECNKMAQKYCQLGLKQNNKKKENHYLTITQRWTDRRNGLQNLLLEIEERQ